MIRILKSNSPINFILMFIVMTLLWTLKFIYMPQPTESYEHYYYLFPDIGESRMTQYISSIIAFLLYFVFAFYIIKINSDLAIIESGYQSPGMFFLILTGAYVNVQRISPEFIAAMLIFIALVRIMYSYKKNNAYGNCFDAGFLFGISFFLVYKFIIFIPVIFLALIIIRPFKWREFASMLIGIICFSVLAISLIYLYGDIYSFIESIKLSFSETYIRFNKYNLYIFLPIIILSGIAIISKFALHVAKNIFTRKSQNILIIFLVFSILYFISPLSNNETIVMIYAPLGLLLSNILINTNKLSGNILFWGSLLCVIFLQIIQYKVIILI